MKQTTFKTIETIVNKCQKDMDAIIATADKKGLYVTFNENEEKTKKLKKRFEKVYKYNTLKYYYDIERFLSEVNYFIENHKKSLAEDINRSFDFLGNDQIKVKNDAYLWNISFMSESWLPYADLRDSSTKGQIIKRWQNGKYIIQLSPEQYQKLERLTK